jgi:thioredoxin reductase (NADPH)
MQKLSKDIAIIGAGPVGLFAVFQAGMLDMSCAVIDSLPQLGGQCSAMYPEKPIYDIPAYPEISGADLITQLEAQAEPCQPTYLLDQTVNSVTQQADGSWELKTSLGNVVSAKVVFIAAGGGSFGPNRPPLAGLEAYEGAGAVRYMVLRKDEFAGKKLVIAGGGDSAVDWANALSDLTEKLYVVHRRAKFRALPESLKKMEEKVAQGKIEMVVPYQLSGLQGRDGQLQAVEVETLEGEKRQLEADFLLPFFGLAMDLGPILEWQLDLHNKHIVVDPATMQTNRKGIYAIGDICTYAGKLKLILTGFAEAAIACHNAHNVVKPDTVLRFEYSTTKGAPCSKKIA